MGWVYHIRVSACLYLCISLILFPTPVLGRHRRRRAHHRRPPPFSISSSLRGVYAQTSPCCSPPPSPRPAHLRVGLAVLLATTSTTTTTPPFPFLCSTSTQFSSHRRCAPPVPSRVSLARQLAPPPAPSAFHQPSSVERDAGWRVPNAPGTHAVSICSLLPSLSLICCVCACVP